MSNTEKQLKLKLIASEFLTIWEDFCKEHTKLYDYTCEEYVHLLASDIEKLEETIEEKNSLLEYIKSLDENRTSLLSNFEQYAEGEKVEKVNQVLAVFKKKELVAEAKQLEKLNQLLLDIIEKIQEQNKRNQFFLNKAILSLKDLKKNFAGKKCYTTYGANGATKT